MSRLVFPAPLLSKLREELLCEPLESCAVIFGSACTLSGRLTRIVGREVEIAPPDAYIRRTATSAELSPDFVAHIAQRARRSGESVVFVHTHPFELDDFSGIDDLGEDRLAEFLARRTPGVHHGALLLTPNVSRARVLGRREDLRVAEIGEQLALMVPGETAAEPAFDRQIRAFGLVGQKKMASLRVAIVGLGGTGSIVAQELAHLGVQRFLLVDPDRLEAPNLNRVVGSRNVDVGRPKVDVARDLIHAINPDAAVEALAASILGTATAQQLSDVDFLFSCTDSHGSRSVLNQVSYQYLVPGIDVGVAIVVRDGRVTHIAGRARMLCPGLGCLVCENILDAEEVRRDFMSEDERKRDQYIVGGAEPQPAVISLNGTVSSLAVTMFVAAVAGIPAGARFVNYNAVLGTVRSVHIEPTPKCVICSPSGAFARGASWNLSTRDDW